MISPTKRWQQSGYGGMDEDAEGEYVLASDHERIVAEKDAEIERLMASRAIVPRDAELLSLNGKFRDSIATQERMLTVLVDCIIKEIHRCGNWPEGREAIALATAIKNGEL